VQERNTIIVVILIVIAVVAGGYVWTADWFATDESDLVELTHIFDDGPPTPERGKEIDQVIDRHTKGMSENQQNEFFLNTMLPILVPIMVKRHSDEYDKLMAMSPEERNRELDRRIDEEARDGGPFGGPDGPDGDDDPDPTAEQINKFRAKLLDMITPDQRAKLSNLRMLMEQRMAERGIESPEDDFDLF
jgi:hypothetical protein